ncbi:MAG TPA: metallophosphoesterase [Jatrophihabitans sp.]|nr:metallophosphoesterase [Jatrophihabitans sp.]
MARVLAGVAGTQLGLRLARSRPGWVGPLQVSARVELAGDGGLHVDVPPLGSARIATHRGPLRVTASATGLDPSRAEGLLRMPDGSAGAAHLKAQLDATLASAGHDLRHLARALAIRSALAGVGGAAALAAIGLRRPRDVAAAGAAAAATLAAAGATAAATRNRSAWRDPQLTGLLTEAPRMLGDLQTAPLRMATYRDQLADLLRTGAAVYRAVTELPEPPPERAVRLLHISDIHLSPLALPLAKALVEQYRVDAVLDTGDFVDWGTPAEQALVGQIAGIGVPYVFVKGNHDSTGIADAVSRQPNATVLTADTGPVEIAGLRFAGLADPRFTPDKTTGDDHAPHLVPEAAAEFAAKLRADGRQVDIALVHSPVAARALEGLVPLVLAGDVHRRSVRRYGETTVLVQGSTGGSGLRGVQEDPPTPLTLSVLYVDRTTRTLWGADEMTLGGIGSVQLSVVRRSTDDLLGAG